MDGQTFEWTSQIQTGLVLFAVSLLYLAFVAPGEIGISTAIGGGSALALYGITGSRLSLAVLTMLMLVVSGCALFSALLENGLALLPVAVAQIVSITLMERNESRFWIRHEELPAAKRV